MYYRFIDEYSGEPYGSCEIFYTDGSDSDRLPGWYWWACFPGCMPDGDEHGPFDTEQEAMDDAEVA